MAAQRSAKRVGRQIVMQILKRNVLKWKPLTETINATHAQLVLFLFLVLLLGENIPWLQLVTTEVSDVLGIGRACAVASAWSCLLSLSSFWLIA